MDKTTRNVDPGLSYHLENFLNPHVVTKEQVGLGNVEDVKQYSELNPPPNYIESVCSKKPDATGNIKLVKGDVGLGKLDNLKQYSEVNQPPYPVTSVNGMTGAVVIQAGEGGDTTALEGALNAHVQSRINPHCVTKAQIGLDKVDNTKDIEKPISAATQAVLDTKLNASDYIPCDGVQLEEDLLNHTSSKINPHGVTKAQVGLDKVNNTSDLEKPISAAMQTVLDTKLNASDYIPCDGVQLEEDLLNHTSSKVNPHSVTKAQIGLDKVDNTPDLEKPISLATQFELNTKLNVNDYIPCDGVQLEEDLQNHTANRSNPHGVTKEQLGLGNVPKMSRGTFVPTSNMTYASPYSFNYAKVGNIYYFSGVITLGGNFVANSTNINVGGLPEQSKIIGGEGSFYTNGVVHANSASSTTYAMPAGLNITSSGMRFWIGLMANGATRYAQHYAFKSGQNLTVSGWYMIEE